MGRPSAALFHEALRDRMVAGIEFPSSFSTSMKLFCGSMKYVVGSIRLRTEPSEKSGTTPTICEGWESVKPNLPLTCPRDSKSGSCRPRPSGWHSPAPARPIHSR